MARADIRAGRAFVELLLKDGEYLRGLKNARQKLQDFSADIGAVGRSLAQISGAVLIPVGLAVRVFAQFDDKMREVRAVSQATDKQFASLTQTAKKLGATTSFTAIQVASLMAELGRAGFDPDQVNEMTEAVLNLARATSTDATLASGIMAASIRQFGLGAGDAAKVSDLLTVAANKSFNSVESLGEALSYAGPVSADFNMSMEDTLAILGLLGNVGIQGSNAGTALRRMLTLTGSEAEKMNEIFGVTFVDAAGNARPLVDVLEEVNEATKDLGTGDRAKKFNEAFGILGITSASAISKNVVSIRELQEALNGAGGSAAKAAADMDAGIGGSFRILMSAVEGIAIAIGEKLNKQIKELANWLTDVATDVIDFVAVNSEMIVTVTKAAAAIGAIGVSLMAMGAFAGIASSVMSGIAGIATAVQALSMAGALLVANPVAAAVVAIGIAAVGTAIGIADMSRHTAKLNDEMLKARQLTEKQNTGYAALAKRLQELSDKQNKTGAEMQEMAGITNHLQRDFGDLGLTIDSSTGKVAGLASGMESLFEVMKQRELNSLNGELREIESNIDELNKQMQSAQGWANTAGGFNAIRNMLGLGAEADIESAATQLEEANKRWLEARKRRKQLMSGEADGTTTAEEGGGATEAAKAARDAAEEAIDAQKRWDEIQEELAANSRNRYEQEIHDIEKLAEERRKLLKIRMDGEKSRAGGARPETMAAMEAEQQQIEIDRDIALGETAVREQEELDRRGQDREEAAAEEAKRKQDQANQTKDEIARLEIEANPSLDDKQKRLASLEIERKRAVEDAKANGEDVSGVERIFELRRQIAGGEPVARDMEKDLVGSFSASALVAGAGGGSAADRTAKSTEVVAKEAIVQSKRLEKIQKALEDGGLMTA